MKEKKIVIFGRDRRQSVAARFLSDSGCSCVLIGEDREKDDGKTAALPFAPSLLHDACAVLLPIPSVTKEGLIPLASVNGLIPFASVNGLIPFAAEKEGISLAAVLFALPKNAYLFAAMLSEEQQRLCREKDIHYRDFLSCDIIEKENTAATAEGAVSLLIENVPRTLHCLPVAVTGFGRIGRALCERLLPLGASVTVFARREEVRETARAMGCKAEPMECLPALLPSFAALCNTVPFPLIGESDWDCVGGDLFLLELASAPGGFDPARAEKRGLRVVTAPGLPGKIAPVGVGEAIGKAVLLILQSRDESPSAN